MSTDRNPDYDYRMITVNDVAALSQQIIAEVERAIVGKTEVLRMIPAACLSTEATCCWRTTWPRKTLIANSFATVLGLDVPAHPVHT